MAVQHGYMAVQQGYMLDKLSTNQVDFSQMAEVQQGYIGVQQGYIGVQYGYMAVQQGYMLHCCGKNVWDTSLGQKNIQSQYFIDLIVIYGENSYHKL